MQRLNYFAYLGNDTWKTAIANNFQNGYHYQCAKISFTVEFSYWLNAEISDELEVWITGDTRQ